MNLSELFFSETNTDAIQRNVGEYEICFYHPDKFMLEDDEISRLDQVFDGIVTEEPNSPGVSCGYMPPINNRVPAYFKRRVYGSSLMFRNFVHPAQPFRRVVCMSRAINAGIPTPNLLACARKQKHGVTSAIYICTEYVSDAVPVQALFARPDARARVTLFIEDGVRLLASLHKNYFYYSKLSLESFYYRDAVLSIWNPAWIHSFSSSSKKHILNDLAVFARAVTDEAIKHRPELESFIEFNAIAEEVIISYLEIAPGWVPSCTELSRAIAKIN